MRSSKVFRGLWLLGASFWLALAAIPSAQAIEIFSNQTIADTFNARATFRWRDEDAATRSAEQAVAQKVRDAIRRYQRQSAACDDGERCAMSGWYGFLASLRGVSPLAKLDAVNRWVNRFPYVSDWQNWGVADYWESPAELIAHGGQCEDYAMVKYLALRALGFEDSAMRIVAVRDGADDHAVLVVRLRGRLYLLDNLEQNVVDSAQAPDYRLIYAVNDRVFSLYRNTEIPIPGAPAPTPEPSASEPPAMTAAADPVPPAAPAIPGVRPITTAEIAREPLPTAVVATDPVSTASAETATSAVAAAAFAPVTQIAFAAPVSEPALPPASLDQEAPASPY